MSELTVCTRTNDARRLEEAWATRFGRDYTDRNSCADERAGQFHFDLCQKLNVRRVLEVGCNVGLNLTRLGARRDQPTATPSVSTWGVDIGSYAVAQAKRRLPDANFTSGSVYQLPFRDASFDLVFTCGVLIHIPPDDLQQAVGEVFRTSARYIWCGEYYAENPTEVPYRGLGGSLFKRDFGAYYLSCFSELELVDDGFLEKETTGFDNLRWWLLRKR